MIVLKPDYNEQGLNWNKQEETRGRALSSESVVCAANANAISSCLSTSPGLISPVSSFLRHKNLIKITFRF